MTGALERLPGALEEHSVLGVGVLGLARVDLEERGVEQIGALEGHTDAYVVGTLDEPWQQRVGAQLLFGERATAVAALAQVSPERREIGRAREPAGHPDDRDQVGHGSPSLGWVGLLRCWRAARR
jgi:hypothetical protein